MSYAFKEQDHPIRPHNAGPSSVWSAGGHGYDEVSRGIGDAIEHCINRLEPRHGEKIMDLATGTGWTARRLADRGFNVTAVDFAADVVAAGARYAAQRNLAIEFEQGDAEALAHATGSFDAVISTFGVMFASHPEDAAAELGRVVRPGGRLALAVWTPDGNVFEMFKIMKAFMPSPVGDPPPSPFAWGNLERVRDLLGEDFELAFESGTSFYREPDGEASWDTFYEGYGPTRALAGKLDGVSRAELKHAWVAFHEQFKTEMGICVPRDYWIVRGIRR
jgi:SAM-dependent methyltransferase